MKARCIGFVWSALLGLSSTGLLGVGSDEEGACNHLKHLLAEDCYYVEDDDLLLVRVRGNEEQSRSRIRELNRAMNAIGRNSVLPSGKQQALRPGPEQTEAVNFVAMRDALEREHILDLHEAGIRTLLERLGEQVQVVGCIEYVTAGDVIDHWIAEAPAWRGPFMYVLFDDLPGECPWRTAFLEWARLQADIQALADRVRRVLW